MNGLYREGQVWPALAWEGDMPPALVGLLAMGWEQVELTPTPPDTATTTFDATNVDGVLAWVERPKTGEELDRARREALGEVVAQAIPWLRQRAAAADAVTVTAGNAVVVLQAVVDDLAVFLARFADWLEATGVDE
jgi:hypothetical protein